jgi:hypothetical protein
VRNYNRFIVLSLSLGLIGLFCCSPNNNEAAAAGNSTYQDLVKLFEEWREFQKPVIVDAVPDYTADALAKQHLDLKSYQARLAAIDPSSWPVSQQVDYHIVRASTTACCGLGRGIPDFMRCITHPRRMCRPWRDRGGMGHSACGSTPIRSRVSSMMISRCD